MGRAEQRLFTVGRFWLAQRDQSPFYQVRWYDEATKTTRGKSTGCRALADAKRFILRHAEEDLASGPQEVEEKLVAAVLMQYWREKGQTRLNPNASANSLRVFLAFMDQDKIGMDATVAALTPPVFKRFAKWRMGPHSYEIEWQQMTFTLSRPTADQ